MYGTDERNPPRTVDEAYCSAITTSDMRVQADIRGDADVVIAAGWSPTRIGSALLRLHTEWDRSEMPRKPTRKSIEAMAYAMRKPYLEASAALERFEKRMDTCEEHKARQKLLADTKASFAITPKEAEERAREEAYGWYVAELEMLMGKLKSLPDVRRELSETAERWGMEAAAAKVPGVIGWWLHCSCPICNGTKETVVQGSNRQSGKACRGCQGSGVTSVPYGSDGRRVANYMDECVQAARESIRKRLRATRN